MSDDRTDLPPHAVMIGHESPDGTFTTTCRPTCDACLDWWAARDRGALAATVRNRLPMAFNGRPRRLPPGRRTTVAMAALFTLAAASMDTGDQDA